MRASRLLPCLLLLAAAARADVLHVPKDVPTIQLAVDAAEDGDIVLIAAGSYDEQVVMLNVHHVVVRGQGVVELTGEPTDIGFVMDGCIGSSIEKLRFRDVGLALRVTGCVGAVVSNCRAADMDEVGFSVFNTTDTLLDRCQVDGVTDQGFDVVGAYGCELRRCTVRNAGSGLRVTDSLAVEVDHFRAETISGTGIIVTDPCSGLEVHHSRLEGLGGAGIITFADDGWFHHDLIVDAGDSGIVASSGAKRNLFEQERVVHCGGAGLQLGGERQEARGCRVTQSQGPGVLCAEGDSHVIRDARIVNSDDDGVRITGPLAIDCVLLDNRVTNPAGNGFNVTADLATLTGNKVKNAGQDGFLIESLDNALVGNKATGSILFDLHDTAGGSMYVENVFGTVAP